MYYITYRWKFYDIAHTLKKGSNARTCTHCVSGINQICEMRRTLIITVVYSTTNAKRQNIYSTSTRKLV